MFLVLHSSAGAGKTHALVKHYLAHCLTGDDHGAYRQVLALTFTNKAAAEMKERVISYLELLAKGGTSDARIQDVLEYLEKRSGVNASTLSERADAVLGHMLHHWSDVAISTIDAFTRRVVRPFARDLRMDHDLKMITEQQYYLERAVTRLIDAAGSDERITAVLTQACLQLLHDERSWDPAKPLLELSQELLKENSIKPLERLRAFSLEDLAPLTERLNRANTEFRRKVNLIGNRSFALFADHGIEEADVAYGKGGVWGYFRKLAAFSDIWEPPGSQTLKPFETGKWHSGKASPSAITALDGIANRLTEFFQQAESLRIDELRDHLIRRAVVRELLPAFALHELDQKLEELKQEDGVAFFSDLTRRVAEVVKDEPVPFIYERLGERYRHFLIDEFQDTSLLQWNALLPLIENALSTGGTTLLVGDAKQAIYRWRNGEVRLFVELPKIFGRDAHDTVEAEREAILDRNFHRGERLIHNRRSAKRIIAFNNALFAELAELLPPSLRKVYDQHEQEMSHSDEGLVSVVLAEKGLRGSALQDFTLDRTLTAVTESLAAGFSPGDVAVLVRSKRTGRAVAAHLLANGHAVVSPDGLQLAADPLIQLLVELLRFLHTGDAIAATRALQWRSIVQSQRRSVAEIGTEKVNLFTPGAQLPDPVEVLRTSLASQGSPRLQTTLTALIRELSLALGIGPADDAAVLTFLDEVHAWTTDHASEISGFLEHWERSGGERSSAAPEQGSAIQVMTVHKSKGLQFPVVIVPDACMVGGKRQGELFWVDPGEAVPELDVALIREGKVTRAAELLELIEEDGLRTLDALNLLYVAFTRAEQRLYATVPDANDIVTARLSNFVTDHPEFAVPPALKESPRTRRDAAPFEQLHDVRGTIATLDRSIRFEAPEEWDPAEADPYRAFGTAVHGALAETRTAADLGSALHRAVVRNELTAEQAGSLMRRLHPRISSPELAPWFAPSKDVRSEATLIDTEGQSHRPDRVLIEGNKIRVLEFKTGRPSPAHEAQLQSYLVLFRKLGYKDVEGVIWYLFDDRLEPVN